MEFIDLNAYTLYWNTQVIGVENIPVEISFGIDTPNVVIDPATATQEEMVEMYNKGMWHLFNVESK